MILDPARFPAGTVLPESGYGHPSRRYIEFPNGLTVFVEHRLTWVRTSERPFFDDPTDWNVYTSTRAFHFGGPDAYRLHAGEPRWETHTRDEFDHLMGLLYQSRGS